MHRFFILFLILTAGFARHTKALEAVVNHAEFRSGAAGAYTEIYWQIRPTSLHYQKDSTGRLKARIRTQIRITSDTGIVYKDVYYLQTRPFNPETEDARPILEQARVDVPPGSLRLEVYLSEDTHNEGRFYYSDTLHIAATSGPAYSTVQLLDTFFASGTAGPFLKAGYYQQPRPLNFYDEGQHNVHAYMELYRTGALDPQAFPLVQTVYLSKNPGKSDLPDHLVRDTIRAGGPILRFRQSFTTADLPSGNYYVNASLKSAAGTELAGASAFLQSINRNPVVKADSTKEVITSVEQVKGTYLDLSKTFVSKFDMAQLRSILKMLLPGAQPAEVSAINGFLDRPDELYIRYFIYNHFLNINKGDPGKAWKDFSDVVREVNRLYKSGTTMGYETDRGIVHLRYGAPVEVVRVPNEAGAVPYEIWRYDVGGKIGGSGLFLFYSPAYMVSDYRLLHSTVPGERNNPGWRGALYSTGRSSGNANARAEQYFGNQ